MAKLHAARCPTCGANIQVPPHAHSIQCRYCGNLITVAHQKPPPTQMTGIPSTTLYIDPEEIAKAGRRVGCIIASAIGLAVLLPAIIGLIAWGGGHVKSKVRPFPAECGHSEEIELSGDWTGTGPVIEKAAYGCKIHISNAKLKAPTLIKTSSSGVEITLENVTLETTEAAIQGDSNLKLRLVNTTITSTGDVAVKLGHNATIEATASKINGKKAAIDLEANGKLTFKNATELTSEGVAIKTKSNMNIDAEGGKIDGGEGAIVATSGTKITAKNVIFNSKGKTLRFTSSAVLDFTDGAITSSGESAVETDSSGDYTFAGTKIQGVTSAITGKSGLKLKASKKAALVATTGDCLDLTSNGKITLADASLDGARNAIKSDFNLEMKLSQGARVTGKKGGVITESNLELDATGATIDGGSGPGLDFDSNAKIEMQQGTLKGTPAIKATRKPSKLTLDGTKVEGDQQIPKR